jgi:low affinity Fe/Cu permease
MGRSKKNKSLELKFEKIAIQLTKFSGSTTAFILALLIIIAWLISGPLLDYSETWQLIINTGTTIITFLMVFLIQRTQNKDSMAIQLKLNELIASTEGASNRLIEVEELSEEELKILKKYFLKLSSMVEKEKNLKESHSIEEAEVRHKNKLKTKS